MKRALLVTSFVWLGAAPAWAIMTPSVAALGWTKDGTAFVWALSFEDPESWTVVPAAGGKPVVLTKQADFDAFVAKHAMAEEPTSRPTSPDGKARVTVTGGKVEDGELRLAGKKGRVTLERGNDKGPAETYEAPGSVSVHWSPDGRRVALFYQEREVCAPTGTGDYSCNDPRREVVLLPVAGPRVQLLGKGLEPGVFERTARALETAGFAVTGEDTAQVARDFSVVYAPKALAGAARVLADAVPGGATVEVLSWKTRFDVVVALGASAK
jgi:hypothetical protein